MNYFIDTIAFVGLIGTLIAVLFVGCALLDTCTV